MIWTYPIYHFLEKHWYDSFLHLYRKRLGDAIFSILIFPFSFAS